MSSKDSLPSRPPQPKHDVAKNAYLILRHAHDSAESLLKAFDTVRSVPGPTGKPKMGAPTDEQQDLLRAMVVFAGAGVDSVTKQLVRDALPKVVKKDDAAHEQLLKFTARQLRREGEADEASSINVKLLSELLVAQSAGDTLIDRLVGELTGGSLQSTEQLFKCLSHLGIGKTDVKLDQAELGPVFECRNQIVHELDIDFSQPNRNRFPRRRKDMIRYARQLLEVAGSILAAVDRKFPTVDGRRKRQPSV